MIHPPLVESDEPAANVAARDGARSLNTILLYITVSVLAFISYQGVQNALGLARIEGALVTRSEVETKIAEVKVAQTALDKELQALKLALAERGIKSKDKE